MTPPGSYRRGDDMQILANPETTKNLIIKKHEIKNLKKFMRPIENTRISKRRINKGFLARLGGFEPSTYGLEGRCSIQLSYRLIFLNHNPKQLFQESG